MRGFLPPLLICILTLAGFGWWQHGRAEAALSRAKTAEAQVAGYQEAAAMLDGHLQAVRAERDRWATVAAELEKMEGADEPLNAYERAVLDRVRAAP